MYIVATISKNSYPAEKVREIIEAGATVLRYNFSHGTPEEMAEKIRIARDVIRVCGKEGEVKLLADLPGGKIRLGGFPNGEYSVSAGDEVFFQKGEYSEHPESFVPVVCDRIGTLVTVGQTVTVGDGELAFVVKAIVNDDAFRAAAVNARHIPAFKGLNIGGAIDTLDHLTAHTRVHIEHLSVLRPDLVAFSFVNSLSYIREAKRLLAAAGRDGWCPKIVAKIESPGGIDNLEAIIPEVDIILVARGDLGLTMPIEQLGVLQKRIVADTLAAGKEVIVSTQILDSLLSYVVPSRAEVLDLTNIVLDGAQGIMLAKETGISATPGYSVQVAQRIIDAVQRGGSTK